MTSRRDFLKTSVLASSVLFVPKFLHALDRQGLRKLADANGRRLVVVQLGGGNDGLNTITLSYTFYPVRDPAPKPLAATEPDKAKGNL